MTQIWYTPFPKDSMNVAHVTYMHPDRDIQGRHSTLLSNATGPWPPDVPRPVFSMEYTDPLGPSAYRLPDMFHTKQAVLISERVRDLLSNFDMGRNDMLEAPLVEQNGQVPVPGRWFVLRIVERKEGVVPEASETGTKVWMKPQSGDNALVLTTTRRGKQFWYLSVSSGSDAPRGVAVKKSVSSGADLWADPLLYAAGHQAFFVTDRLYRAIISAELKVRSLHFAPAIMVDDSG